MEKKNQSTIYPGKFIVIDGTDGSGKATQTELLANRLTQAGFSVMIADFPQYNTKSSGLVEEYLSGKYGRAELVGPYQASIFYACDRYDASFKIREWLRQGKIVISNRYVTANMGHQGGKIDNPLERKHFFNWLNELEYEIFNIPRPDLNIILHVPAEISQKLAQLRQKQDWIEKTKDIHENSLIHLKNAEQAYLEIVKTFPDFILIECASDGQMLEREQISDLVWQKINKKFNIFSQTPAPAIKRKMLIKRLSPLAFIPTRAEHEKPLFNLYSAVGLKIEPHQTASIKTGLKIHLPENYAGLIMDYPNNLKNNLITAKNRIYSESTSEIIISLTNLSRESIIIAAGQKIAQMLIIG